MLRPIREQISRIIVRSQKTFPRIFHFPRIGKRGGRKRDRKKSIIKFLVIYHRFSGNDSWGIILHSPSDLFLYSSRMSWEILSIEITFWRLEKRLTWLTFCLDLFIGLCLSFLQFSLWFSLIFWEMRGNWDDRLEKNYERKKLNKIWGKLTKTLERLWKFWKITKKWSKF